MNGPIRLRQHGTFSIFLEKKWLGEPLFFQIRMSDSALPEAIAPSRGVTVYVVLFERYWGQGQTVVFLTPNPYPLTPTP